MERIEVNTIRIGKRFRQEMGDIAGMARSLKEIGLLQPIGVTDGNELVFGARRLVAAKELGWKMIHAVRVNLDAIITGEYHENAMRKELTVSERTAIGIAIEEKIGKRQGKRTDKAEPDGAPQLRRICGEVESGERTSDFAAKQAGFGSSESYERAKKVTVNGTAKLKEAVDNEEISISDAAAVAGESPEVQDKAVDAKRAGKARTAKEGAAKAKRERKTKPTSSESTPGSEPELKVELDGIGIPVPDKILEAFSVRKKFTECLQHMRSASKLINDIAQSIGGERLRGTTQPVGERFRCNDLWNSIKKIEAAMPFVSVCPWCYKHGGVSKKCPGCRGLGWINEIEWKNKAMPDDVRKPVEKLAGTNLVAF